MEDPVYLSDEHVLSRMLASETRQEMESYFETRVQRDFSDNDRRELAIWMRDVCDVEECQPDIFPLSMLIVDRFLSFVRTKRTQLQLLGSVALLLASKLRQTSQIPAKKIIYYTRDLITLNELRTWELLVLSTLKWDLALITPVDYLDIFIRRMKLSDEQMISDIEDEAQKMIIECCLELKYSLYPPSIIAWACLMRAMETWQLTSDHLHLTTSVVAKEANNFMSKTTAAAEKAAAAAAAATTAAASQQQSGVYSNNASKQHNQFISRDDYDNSAGGTYDNDVDDGVGSSPLGVSTSQLGYPYHQHPHHHHHQHHHKHNPNYQNHPYRHQMTNGLNHFVLKANLAALDWN